MATQASTTNHSTQGPQRTAVTDGERTIGQIVSDATTNAQSLVRDEIALAKAEINADVQKGVKTGIGFGIAAFFGIFAFMMFLFAAAWGIATVLPTWAGFLIVGGVLMSSAVAALLNTVFTPEQVDAWAWRLPVRGRAPTRCCGMRTRPCSMPSVSRVACFMSTTSASTAALATRPIWKASCVARCVVTNWSCITSRACA